MGSVGHRIEQFRKKLKWSQTQLTEALGSKSHGRVLNWEKGEKVQWLFTTRAVAQAFGVCPGELYDPPICPAHGLDELLRLVQKLDDHDRQTVLELARSLAARQTE